MSHPRIYIVISTFHPIVGGAEKQALMQGRSLRERGFAASVITFRHKWHWLAREVITGVPVIRVAGKLLGKRENLPRLYQKLLYLLAMIMMTWTLWRQRHNYDILHLYQLNLLALPIALVCCLSGKPLVVAVRSALLKEQAASNRGSHNREMPARIIHDLADLERFGKPLVRFTRYLLQINHAVVVVLSSRMQAYLAERDFNLPDIQLIPNGVDSQRFNTVPSGTEENKRGQTVVCVSRLTYEKGIDVLLQAWHLVHKQMPLARLILVGDGSLRSQLACMAWELDIAGSVEFAGEQSDIPAQLHRGSIGVLPSRHEGMPNALLEAMACGLPCVATRVSGSEDIIQHGTNGLLVELEDYQAMAQALLILLRNPVLVEQYGQAARSTIEKNYSLERITDIYIELYRKLWARRADMWREGFPLNLA